MSYTKFIYILLFFFLTNCTSNSLNQNRLTHTKDIHFSNKGFALIFNDDLYQKKIVTKKIDSRSLIIFQKNLKKDTHVKITNLTNQKSLIAKVGNTPLYPSFYNSVISKRIANELNIIIDDPYVEIKSILIDSTYVANKAKTFDEEKQVANKAPVDSISINNLSVESVKKENKKIKENNFFYSIKIGDFYFKKSADAMVDRIINETKVKNVKTSKLFKTKYRVYLGPFDNISSLQNSFNDISILGFENIEIIKND